MSAVGTPLSYVEFLSYLLVGLNSDYDTFATFVTTRLKLLSLDELYSLFLTHESCLAHTNHLPHRQISQQISPSRPFLAIVVFIVGTLTVVIEAVAKVTQTLSLLIYLLPIYQPNLLLFYPLQTHLSRLCQNWSCCLTLYYYKFNHFYQNDPPKSFTANYMTSALNLDFNDTPTLLPQITLHII